MSGTWVTKETAIPKIRRKDGSVLRPTASDVSIRVPAKSLEALSSAPTL
jgi:hypothetical protein